MSAPFAIISLDSEKTNAEVFAQQLGSNFLQWGFCGIQDHRIDLNLIDNVMELFEEFFALPLTTKMQYFNTKLKGARGYTPTRIETPKGSNFADLKEFWHVGRNLDLNDPYRKWMRDNFIINEMPELSKKANILFTQFDKLGQNLLESIALYLDLEEDHFSNAVDKGNSVMRAIHYPPVKNNEIGERAGAHEDINLITLLIGGHKSGLEILSQEGEWQDATVDEDVIICNIGDMLQRLTNNYLRSTTHRVSSSLLQSESSRYSIPFFVHPNLFKVS